MLRNLFVLRVWVMFWGRRSKKLPILKPRDKASYFLPGKGDWSVAFTFSEIDEIVFYNTSSEYYSSFKGFLKKVIDQVIDKYRKHDLEKLFIQKLDTGMKKVFKRVSLHFPNCRNTITRFHSKATSHTKDNISKLTAFLRQLKNLETVYFDYACKYDEYFFVELYRLVQYKAVEEKKKINVGFINLYKDVFFDGETEVIRQVRVGYLCFLMSLNCKRFFYTHTDEDNNIDFMHLFLTAADLISRKSEKCYPEIYLGNFFRCQTAGAINNTPKYDAYTSLNEYIELHGHMNEKEVPNSFESI